MKNFVIVFNLAIALLLFFCHRFTCDVIQVDKKNFAELYEQGKRAYLENDWRGCIRHFEAAISNHRRYTQAVLECKRKCKIVPKEKLILKDDLPTMASDEELVFYQKKIVTTLCLIKCKQDTLGDLMDGEYVAKAALDLFESYEPYNYLQLCYYQRRQYKDALSAAFTFFVHNLDNDVAKTNLEYYLELTGTPLDEVTNRESHPHTELFYKAKDQYEDGDWPEAIADFEAALENFFDGLERCQLSCEKPFDQGWFPDFVSSIANHFTYCLKCKVGCYDWMANLDGKEMEDLVPLIFNYLQYSYYKIGNFTEAAKCVTSYQLFKPKDKNMANNKKFYIGELGIPETDFEHPRPKAQAYCRQRENEQALLEFIEQNFIFDNSSAKAERSDDELIKPTLIETTTTTTAPGNGGHQDEQQHEDL